MKNILIFTALLSLISGCSSTTLNYKADLSSMKVNENTSYVILGQTLSSSTDISTIIPMLYVDGEKMTVKGVTKKENAPILIPLLVYKGAIYTKTDSNGHAYSVWEIKGNNHADNIVFIHGVHSDQSTYRPIHSSPWKLFPMPIGFEQNSDLLKRMTTKNFDNWRFYGCPFKIQTQGVYYLGEIEVSTGKIDTIYKVDYNILELSNFNMVLYEDNSLLKSFIKGTELEKLPIINLHKNWRYYKGTKLKDYINKL